MENRVCNDVAGEKKADGSLRQSLCFMVLAASAAIAVWPQAACAAAPTTLTYQSLKEGKGASPTETDIVRVNYRGTLYESGREFDSTYARGEPVEFMLGGVIPCWTEGVQRMKVGGKARLICPPDTAYGSQAAGTIPPNSTLSFEIELLQIKKPPAEDLQSAVAYPEPESVEPAPEPARQEAPKEDVQDRSHDTKRSFVKLLGAMAAVGSAVMEHKGMTGATSASSGMGSTRVEFVNADGLPRNMIYRPLNCTTLVPHPTLNPPGGGKWKALRNNCSFPVRGGWAFDASRYPRSDYRYTQVAKYSTSHNRSAYSNDGINEIGDGWELAPGEVGEKWRFNPNVEAADDYFKIGRQVSCRQADFLTAANDSQDGRVYLAVGASHAYSATLAAGHYCIVDPCRDDQAEQRAIMGWSDTWRENSECQPRRTPTFRRGGTAN